MPTINYKPYPTELPNVSAGDRYQRITADANAFGAGVGQSLEKLGAQFEKVGDTLATRAIEQQDIYNKTVVREASNAAQMSLNKLLYGDPTDSTTLGYFSTEGRAALDSRPKTSNEALKLFQDARASLSPVQQRLFDQDTDRLRIHSLAQISNHAQRQLLAYRDTETKARLALKEQDVTRAALGDDAGFKEALGGVIVETRQALKDLNLSDSEIELAVQKATSRAVEQRAHGISIKSGGGAALTFIKNNLDHFKDPKQAETLIDKYQGEADKEAALSGAARARAGTTQGLPDIKVPEQYRGAIATAAGKYNVPEELLTRLLQAESGFNPEAVSPTGATGIAQFIQSTANAYGVNRRDPFSSIDGAARYMADLKKQKGSWAEALRGYLGSDPNVAPSYKRSGVIQLAHALDSGGPRASSDVEVWGDSLGVGLRGALKAPGEVQGGATPTQILQKIKARPEGEWQGKTVVLPSGSNGNEMPVVEETISYLKDKGANVIAVGYGPKFPEKNKQLQEITARLGVKLVSAEDVAASEGVHPSPQGYARMAQNVLAKPAVSSPPDLRAIVDRINADPNLSETQRNLAINQIRREHAERSLGQEQAKSDLLIGIEQGTKTLDDIEAQYREELISPETRTLARARLQKIEAEKQARYDAINRIGAGALLDPKRKEDREALNIHFDDLYAREQWKNLPIDKQIDKAVLYSGQHGMVPQQLQSLVRGALHSGRPALAVAGAATVNKLRNTNPQLVAELGDENDLRLANLISTFSGAGVPPEQAFTLATESLKVSKTDRDARVDDYDNGNQRGKTAKERADSDRKWFEGKSNAWFASDPNPDPRLLREFTELTKERYVQMGNLEAARQMSLDDINRVWGRTQVGGELRYMKQAPEKIYGVAQLTPAENAKWMSEQLLTNIGKGTSQDPNNPITKDRIRLEVDPTRSGPVYQVWLKQSNGAWLQMVDGNQQPIRWKPDWNASAEKQRQEEARAKTIEIERQLRRERGERERAVPR